MTVITKPAPPVLPAETVECPALGGEVIVQGLLLSKRMEIYAGLQTDGQFRLIPKFLAHCVVDAAKEPIYTELEWDIFGSSHQEDALRLYHVARRLCGLDVEDSKKK